MTALRVFITGASSGIGFALAKQYAKSGAILGLVSRKQADLERIARELSASELGAQCSTYPADVGDPDAMRHAAEAFTAQYGAPDIVIANAGISVGTLGAMQEDFTVLERILRTNVLGIAATFQPFIAAMTTRGNGTLVTIASVAGIRGLPGSGAYSSSKSAAITWTESLRLELRDTGLTVVTICPGYIATPMAEKGAYWRPFLLAPDVFAERAARVIAAGSRFRVIPWQMGIVAWLLKRIPRWLYDRVFPKNRTKPRNLPT